MEYFKNNFNDCVELLTQIGRESTQVSEIELALFNGYVSTLDDRYIITQFVEKCFPHLELLRTKETPEPLLDLLRAKNFMEIYNSLDSETQEDLWELIHGMVKSSIRWIHEIKEHDGEKYTKRYFCEYKIRNLSKDWEVELV